MIHKPIVTDTTHGPSAICSCGRWRGYFVNAHNLESEHRRHVILIRRAVSYIIHRLPLAGDEQYSAVVVFTVAYDGVVHPLDHIIVHSPTGFEVGYGGSGPADLALSVLADYFGESQSRAEREQLKARGCALAWTHHQQFKRDVISGIHLDPGQCHVITSESLAAWLRVQASLEAGAGEMSGKERETHREGSK